MINLLKRPFIAQSIKIIHGYKLIHNLRKHYGNKCRFFLVRGKTGDIWLYLRFLYSYLIQNDIKHYVLIGDGKGLKAISKLYSYIHADIISTSYYDAISLQTTWCFIGSKKLNMDLSLMWDVELLYNRSAVRMLNPFTFTDSFYWFLFNLDKTKAIPVLPKFNELTLDKEKELKSIGIKKGRTVIISPYAYCVRPIYEEFWILLAKDLEKKGYSVFMMLDSKNEENNFGFPDIFPTYADVSATLEYAGYFIGLRSGFCDIISGCNCNKVILYPTKMDKFDGPFHRSEIEYSSLSNMELCNNANEIECHFCRNPGDLKPEIENFEERIKENKKLITKILSNFPNQTNNMVENF